MIVKDSRTPRGRIETAPRRFSVLDLSEIGGGLGSGEASWQKQTERKALKVLGRKKAA